MTQPDQPFCRAELAPTATDDPKEAIGIPRDEGGPVFGAPWEARAFGAVVALLENGHARLDQFRDCLAAEIAAAETSHRSYYECWLAAAERLLAEDGYVGPEELDARIEQLAAHRS